VSGLTATYVKPRRPGSTPGAIVSTPAHEYGNPGHLLVLPRMYNDLWPVHGRKKRQQEPFPISPWNRRQQGPRLWVEQAELPHPVWEGHVTPILLCAFARQKGVGPVNGREADRAVGSIVGSEGPGGYLPLLQSGRLHGSQSGKSTTHLVTV
jgi:hypothetical protein